MTRNKMIAVGTVLAIGLLLAFAFPLVTKFIEGAALGVRRLWWVILILVLIFLGIRNLKRN
ncbi:MAG: hypothetical protein EB078_11260 [Proteobacteria bacterium]|nr:hypothetical protein [Pseudomonadota bacterium]NDG27738.1 hypothetical protein [Pseudomonadota bacterium]